MTKIWKMNSFTWFKNPICGRRIKEFEVEIEGSSHYSLSNGVLPSLGARSNRGVLLHRSTVSPFNPRYRLIFLSTSLYYTIRFVVWFVHLGFQFLDAIAFFFFGFTLVFWWDIWRVEKGCIAWIACKNVRIDLCF